MRYRFQHDTRLFTGAEHAPVRAEIVRRYGGSMLAMAIHGLHLSQTLADLLVTTTMDGLSAQAAVRETIAYSPLPPTISLACLVADNWSRLAGSLGLPLTGLAEAVRKKTASGFTRPGLVELIRELRELGRQTPEKQFLLRMSRPGVSALKSGDLSILVRRFDHDPQRVLEALTLVHDVATPGKSLLEGLLLEASLAAHTAVLAAEEQEHCVDFGMLERFSDCEKQRQIYFAAVPPKRVPPLGPDDLFGLTGFIDPAPQLHEETETPPDLAPDIRYARRPDVVLAAERLFLISREPGIACLTHLDTATLIIQEDNLERLFRHAMRCDRCACILGLVQLLPRLHQPAPNRSRIRHLAGMSRA